MKPYKKDWKDVKWIYKNLKESVYSFYEKNNGHCNSYKRTKILQDKWKFSYLKWNRE